MKPPARDPWHALRRYTPARIALGRCGASLPTDELLRFGVAHAQARDAVHLPFDAAALANELQALGFETIEVASAAGDRATYLRRPDLGRRLDDASRERLASVDRDDGDVTRLGVVVGDGLSAAAVHAHAVPLLREARPLLEAAGFRLAPIVLAHQARVALGDEIGAVLGVQAVAVLIGERPGLSSPDSLGVYLTWAPRVGRVDAERNCISNIRAAGLGYAETAHKLAWLLVGAQLLGATGVALKEDTAAVLPYESASTADAVLPIRRSDDQG
jgi:ethanolamine ammonia-lyase small subunit